MTKHGTVLVFNPKLSKEQCEKVIALLCEKGIVDHDYYISRPTVESFDTKEGGPVWYVP